MGTLINKAVKRRDGVNNQKGTWSRNGYPLCLEHYLGLQHSWGLKSNQTKPAIAAKLHLLYDKAGT